MIVAMERAAVHAEKRWTTERELAATTVESLDLFMRQHETSVTGKAPGREPVRVPRPWDKPTAVDDGDGGAVGVRAFVSMLMGRG